MENAAEAIKMAGSVLIFVMALSIIMYSFSQVRQTVDIISDYRDRETIYIDGDYYYKGSANTTERTVGLESIIPTIYRAYLENYRIVFTKELLGGENNPIYYYCLNDGTKIAKYSLDLETNLTYLNSEDKKDFVNVSLR